MSSQRASPGTMENKEEIPAEKANRGSHNNFIESAMNDTGPKRKENESHHCPDPTLMHNKDNKKLPDQRIQC